MTVLRNLDLQVEVELVPLKQRQMEAFVRGLGSEASSNAVLYAGTVVRAAVSAGWFATPAWVVDDVDLMEPRCVAWLAEQLALVWKQVMEPDPKA